jgi:septum formation protein
MHLILASASAARRDLLRAAGVDFTVEPAEVDEDLIRTEMSRAHGTTEGCARRLAAEKAKSVSRRFPASVVIGADQILEIGGAWLTKPYDLVGVRQQLLQLRGRDHRLVTAATVALDGEIVWRHIETARLKVRAFSDDFLSSYLERAGSGVTGCVGGYQLEGLGAQLFEEIHGDYFAILGLPLLPLLAYLRLERYLPE